MDSDAPAPSRSFQPLSQREREILVLLDQKLSNHEIAQHLFLARTTVKWYNRQIYNKLGVETRHQAVERARALGLLWQPEPSGGAVVPSPTQRTRFFGREAELSEISTLLQEPDCRLLTLTGPGGIGKTRLALQVAAEQGLHFAQGICFVPLVAVSSPDLVASAVASALGLVFYGSDPPQRQIVRYLHEKQMLLILDNFEHLLEGVDFLSDMLKGAFALKLLVTSRERLNLQEEWVLTLDGLDFPDTQSQTDLDSYSAIQLFVQRARQVQAHFSLSESAEAVKTICQGVEGLPLALELAATWLRAMSCPEVATQISQSIDFLTAPLRNMPERHRSMRIVFEHSWKLLSVMEGTVLQKLSVFRGGFDLESAEQVSGATRLLLAELVDKSLIRWNGNGRYDLHELLRQYAADTLTADQAQTTANKHLAYFLRLAEQAEAHQYGPDHKAWFDRLDVELDNIRAALAWSLQGGTVESGLRIAAALRFFWEYRSHNLEGSTWLERLLVVDQAVSPIVRAKALERAGDFTVNIHSSERALAYSNEALTLAQHIGDPALIAWVLSDLGRTYLDYGPLNAAVRPLDESLTLFRELDDPFGLSHALRRRAWVAYALKDYAYGRMLAEEDLVRSRKAGDQNAIAQSLHILGRILFGLGQDAKNIAPLFAESASLLQELDEGVAAHLPLVLLGDMERFMGDYARAQARYQTALTILPEVWPYQSGLLAHAVAGLAMIATHGGELERSVRLLGAMEKWIAKLDEPLFCSAETIHQHVLSLREWVDDGSFQAAWAAGQSMTIQQVIVCALEHPSSATKTLSPLEPSPLVEPLSARELEVLRLIVAGLTNAEIAQQLYIAVATVKVHAGNIYSKLGIRNRAQAILQAQRMKLP